MNFDVLADTLYVLYITLKAKSQKNFLKMSKPKNIAPFMADFRALFTTKVLYSYKCSNNNKMNISEYIHKMTTNHSLQQSQFFLSRGNSGRTENNNHKGA